MSLISHTLTQECYLVSDTYNEYGEQEFTTSELIKCRFREISQINKFTNREEITADGMFWFEADESVIEGSIVKFESAYYRIEKITKARKLKSNTIHFLKCTASKVQPVSEV